MIQTRDGWLKLANSPDYLERRRVTAQLRAIGYVPATYLGMKPEERVDLIMNAQSTPVAHRPYDGDPVVEVEELVLGEKMAKLIFPKIHDTSLLVHYENQGGRVTTRKLCPWFLAYYGKGWSRYVMLAYCHERKADRWFRLDRIMNADPLDRLTPVDANGLAYKLLHLDPLKHEAIRSAFNRLRGC